MNKIKRISFVIQGLLNVKAINQNMTNIKKFFPDSEIILSLWDNESHKFNELISKYDKLIVNKSYNDCYPSSRINYFNNFSRMNITSFSGINAATNEFVFRMRSDLILKTKKFIKIYEKNMNSTPLFFNKKILVLYSHLGHYDQYNVFFPIPFHVADWLHFGLKVDLLKLFNLNYDVKYIFDEHVCVNNFYNRNWNSWFSTVPNEVFLFRDFFDKSSPYNEPSLDKSWKWQKMMIQKDILMLKPWDVKVISTKYIDWTKRINHKWQYFLYNSNIEYKKFFIKKKKFKKH